MTDSKLLWLSVVKDYQNTPIEMGKYTSYQYQTDPKHLCFVTSRYKFCASMLKGLDTVIEIGGGDGFGSRIVADAVGRLICLDIDEDILESNQTRYASFENMSFDYFDFRKSPYSPLADGIYLVDVIEHLYPQEEPIFMGHLVQSLKKTGVAIIGTPNETTSQYASTGSREAHVNLKNCETLLQLGQTYFDYVFFFGMNDEVLHTGFPQMCHYLWILCANPKHDLESSPISKYSSSQ